MNLLKQLHKHGMDKSIDALDTLAAAYHCPDVAMSETVEFMKPILSILMLSSLILLTGCKSTQQWNNMWLYGSFEQPTQGTK